MGNIKIAMKLTHYCKNHGIKTAKLAKAAPDLYKALDQLHAAALLAGFGLNSQTLWKELLMRCTKLVCHAGRVTVLMDKAKA